MNQAPDPAKARFMIIQAVRLSGALIVLLGIAILARRFASLNRLPDLVGYASLVVGLAEFLVVPQILARKWRSPRP